MKSLVISGKKIVWVCALQLYSELFKCDIVNYSNKVIASPKDLQVPRFQSRVITIISNDCLWSHWYVIGHFFYDNILGCGLYSGIVNYSNW